MFKKSKPKNPVLNFFAKPPEHKKSHKKAFVGLGVFSATCFAVARALENRNT